MCSNDSCGNCYPEKKQQKSLKKLSTVILTVILLSAFSVFPLKAAGEGNKMIEWNDPKIKYIGRWESVENGIQNRFGGFCEIRFSGSSTLSVRKKTNGVTAISVDGSAAVRKELGGSQTVIADNLSSGEHTVRIFTYSQHSQPLITGFVLDSGAELLECKKNRTIEFIGDSVTEGYTGENADSHILSYAHLTAEKLGYDRSIIALGGITVTPGYGYFNDKTGMVNRYFKTRMYGDSADWDTSKFIPDIIVINLGTNDRGQVAQAKIIASYTEFLEKLRAVYPHTPIFAMVPFCHDASLTIAAEKTVQAAVTEKSLKNVYLIETASWGIDPGKDNTHPPKEEHIKAAEKLADIISYYVSNGRLPENNSGSGSNSSGSSSSPASSGSSRNSNSGGNAGISSDSGVSDSVSTETVSDTSSPEQSSSQRSDTAVSDSKTDTPKKGSALKPVLGIVSAAVFVASAGFLAYALKVTGKFEKLFKKREKEK